MKPGQEKSRAIASAVAITLAGIAVAVALVRSSNLRACDRVMSTLVEARFTPEDVAKALGASSQSTYPREQSEALLQLFTRWSDNRDAIRVRANAAISTQVLTRGPMTYVAFYDASGTLTDYVCVATWHLF
jgi:hypothetical protein